MKENSLFSFSYDLKVSKNSYNFFDEIKENMNKRGFEFVSTPEISKKIIFISPSIAFMKHHGEMLFELQQDECRLHIHIKPENLYIQLIVVLLLGSFLTTFSVSAYFIFATVFSIFFIGISILFFRNQFIRIIGSHLLSDNFQESLSDNQKRWIENPNLCPACGSSITQYDWTCDSCGLVVRQKKDFSRFSCTIDSYRYNYTIKD